MSQIEVNAIGAANPMSSQEISKLVQYVQLAMEKNNHLKMLSHLPIEVRKRLRALRKLQLQTSAVEMEFHKKQFELEKDFQEKHNEIFKKRLEIIKGDHEPNDEECNFSDPDVLQRIDQNQEMLTKLKVGDYVYNDDNKEKTEDVDKTDHVENPNAIKGVPNFWYHILFTNSMFDFLIHEYDEPILKHLMDIRTTYQSEPYFSFTLEFEFSPNPFFENSILTKEYLLKMKFDDILCYEGPEIYKIIGCDVMWKTDQGRTPSFLDFFNPPKLPENTVHPLYEEIKGALENDFEIGDYIKDNIIPKAILYFTGERDDESDYEDSFESKSTDGGSGDESDIPDMIEDAQADDVIGK